MDFNKNLPTDILRINSTGLTGALFDSDNWVAGRRVFRFLALVALILLPVSLIFFSTVKLEDPFPGSGGKQLIETMAPAPVVDEDPFSPDGQFGEFHPPPPALLSPGRQRGSFRPMDMETLEKPEIPVNIQADTTRELISRLKEFKLWDVSDLSEVPPVSLISYPANFHKIKDVEDKKRIFFHSLLPNAVLAVQAVADERARLEWVFQKLNRPPETVFFDDNGKWTNLLSDEEKGFIYRLTFKYRTRQAAQLLVRANIVPVSLILAQGAIESAWGGSRFARFGNNIFGIWTWSGKGMIPYRRDVGFTHRVATYDSIRESVRAYLLMLNRVPAYDSFRKIRSETMDPLKLADGLLYYSERRYDYVAEVKQVIEQNHLSDYDRFIFPEKQKYSKNLTVSKLDAHATGYIYPE